MHLDILQPNKAQNAKLFTILILNRTIRSASFRNDFCKSATKVRRVVNVLVSDSSQRCCLQYNWPVALILMDAWVICVSGIDNQRCPPSSNWSAQLSQSS